MTLEWLIRKLQAQRGARYIVQNVGGWVGHPQLPDIVVLILHPISLSDDYKEYNFRYRSEWRFRNGQLMEAREVATFVPNHTDYKG